MTTKFSQAKSDAAIARFLSNIRSTDLQKLLLLIASQDQLFVSFSALLLSKSFFTEKAIRATAVRIENLWQRYREGEGPDQAVVISKNDDGTTISFTYFFGCYIKEHPIEGWEVRNITKLIEKVSKY